MKNKIVEVDEQEYHALKAIAENAKRDYIAHFGGKSDYTPQKEGTAAIETLAALEI